MSVKNLLYINNIRVDHLNDFAKLELLTCINEYLNDLVQIKNVKKSYFSTLNCNFDPSSIPAEYYSLSIDQLKARIAYIKSELFPLLYGSPILQDKSCSELEKELRELRFVLKFKEE
jgi:ribosomal protein L29